MTGDVNTTATAGPIVKAPHEVPKFPPGTRVRISGRSPIGHYRVPFYIRGRQAQVEQVIWPAAVDNEEEGFGRNAGSLSHYYRVIIPLSELWPGYSGSGQDVLRIEIFGSWLEEI